MHRYKILIVTSFILCMGVPALAQTNKFELSGLLSLPVGDFASTSGQNAGFAQFGYGVGIEGNSPVSNTPVYFTESAYLIENFMDNDAYGKALSSGDNYSVSGGGYTNLPILLGFKVIDPFSQRWNYSQNLDFYGSGQIGVDVQWIGRQTYTDNSDASGDEQAQFDPGASFAWCIGAGVIIQKHLDIGIKYFGLGSPSVSGTVTNTSSGTSSTGKVDQSTNLIVVSAGFYF